jgi:pyrrolidone-carboxylate peptidase
MQPHRPEEPLRSTRQLTVEEFRLSDPRVLRLLAGSSLGDRAARFRARLATAEALAQAFEIAEAEGLSLWQAAREAASFTPRSRADELRAASACDDRALYWARLQLTAYLRRSYVPNFALRDGDRQRLIALVERASRGMSDLAFTALTGVGRVLISGFDPFRLDAAADRGNPSGAAALFLDGASIGEGERRAHVRAVIFPVRFRDFDAGIVETTFRPFLMPRPDGTAAIDLLVTISQNNTQGYEIEHWAGRRRTLEASDNVGQYGAHTTTRGTSEIIPLGKTAGEREFEQTSLPVSAMLQARSELGADTLRENMSRLPERGEPAVRGSGGNYLSNEVFYRAASLERTTRRVGALTRTSIPVGHLHVPLMEPPPAPFDAAHTERRRQIVQHVRAILTAALAGLSTRPVPAPASEE